MKKFYRDFKVASQFIMLVNGKTIDKNKLLILKEYVNINLLSWNNLIDYQEQNLEIILINIYN